MYSSEDKEIIKYLFDKYPEEACGLLVNQKGKQVWIPCENTAEDKKENFIISSADYLKASLTGDLMAIIHSHPDASPEPSEHDKKTSNFLGIPYIIYSLPEVQKYTYTPDYSRNPLLGREYEFGKNDCWSLVRDWYNEEKNIKLKDWDRPTTPQEFLEKPLFESCAWRTGFRELRSDEKLQNGDVLLMSIMHPTLNHVALFFDGDVIHHLTDRLSCREPYSEWLLKCTGKRYRYAQES